jgi:cytochrome b subunit of formate dehydrogenase
MQVAESTRRRLGWTLAVAFLVVAVVPLSLFYGLDFRVASDGSCADLRSDMGEMSDWWAGLAFVIGPLVAGLLAYAGIVLFAPGASAVHAGASP